jgi:hypothetical protein
MLHETYVTDGYPSDTNLSAKDSHLDYNHIIMH